MCSHAVGVVSQFSSNPTDTHKTTVKRILSYLKGTIDLQLRYDGNVKSSVEGYCDADWGAASIAVVPRQGMHSSPPGLAFRGIAESSRPWLCQ